MRLSQYPLSSLTPFLSVSPPWRVSRLYTQTSSLVIFFQVKISGVLITLRSYSALFCSKGLDRTTRCGSFLLNLSIEGSVIIGPSYWNAFLRRAWVHPLLDSSHRCAEKHSSVLFLYLQKILIMDVKLVLEILLLWCFLRGFPCVESADEEDTLSGSG